jgi:hypothetical protein
VVAIDGSGSLQETLDIVFEACVEYNIDLHDSFKAPVHHQSKHSSRRSNITSKRVSMGVYGALGQQADW